ADQTAILKAGRDHRCSRGLRRQYLASRRQRHVDHSGRAYRRTPQPAGHQEAPMTELAEACADLAQLIAALIPALTRDNTPRDAPPAKPAGPVVNTDVLHAMLTLTREIPATRAMACRLTGEPCPGRPVLTCLRALPRLESRLTDLGHIVA